MNRPVHMLLAELDWRRVELRVAGGRVMFRDARETQMPARLKGELRARSAELANHLLHWGAMPEVPGGDWPFALLYWERRQGQPDAPTSAADCLSPVAPVIQAYGGSRWGAEADRWSPAVLAGFYASDLLEGLAVVLGPWRGWRRLRAELAHLRGPGAIRALWLAYGELDEGARQRVMDAGDRSLSPPELAAGSLDGGAA